MKKGDLMKQEILRTAEEMFCRKGYQQTSVQDIIDSLNSSKGSFYHHFVSKEAVLEGICSNRAQRVFEHTLIECSITDSIIEKLNILLSGMIPFQEERLSFLLMLLPVFTLQEGRTIRQYYCDALASQFQKPVSELITNGHISRFLFCDDPHNTTTIILSVINLLWVRISDILIRNETLQQEPDLSDCLQLTECSREAVERILSIPYGSLRLIDIPALKLTADRIHNHWTKYDIKNIQGGKQP